MIQQKLTNSKSKDIVIKGYANVYRIHEWTGDRWVPLSKFRVRLRVRNLDGWETNTKTFSTFNEAKLYARNTPRVSKKTSSKEELNKDLFENRFKEFLKFKKSENLAESTIDQYSKLSDHFKFFHDYSVKSLTVKIIDAWQRLLQDQAYLDTQKSTRKDYRHEVTLLRTFFNCYKDNVYPEFSVPLLKRHRVSLSRRSKSDITEIKYLKPHEIPIFLSYLDKDDVLTAMVARIQIFAGLRIGEALALVWENIDFTYHRVVTTGEVRGSIRVGQRLDFQRGKGAKGKITLLRGTKSGEIRHITMVHELFTALLSWRNVSNDSSKLFHLEDKWIAARMIEYRYNKAFKKAGIALSATHCLRHTFATRLLNQGITIPTLQKLLGHAKIEMTMKYANLMSITVDTELAALKPSKDTLVTSLATQGIQTFLKACND